MASHQLLPMLLSSTAGSSRPLKVIDAPVGSGQVARDACQKFFRLGIPSTALTDTPMILQYAAIAEPDDVLIITSQSGRWPAQARAAELARDRGATVIVLSNPDSSLAAAANYLFPFHPNEDASVYTPMSSRLGQLALLDAIHVALALQQGEKAASKLRLSKQALRDM